MAYTQTDLDNINQAVLDYGTGDRVQTLVIGDQTVKFADISLDQLLTLQRAISEQVQTSVSGYSPRAYAYNRGRG